MIVSAQQHFIFILTVLSKLKKLGSVRTATVFERTSIDLQAKVRSTSRGLNPVLTSL